MKKTQILLSTYNGEGYLREQLDSYLGLRGFSDISVLIRDDGSADGTPDILREYSEKYGFSVIYGENIGLNASLRELISNRDRTASYFALSDQDDVWLPDKIAAAQEALGGKDDAKPQLYAAVSHITDEKLNIVGSTLNPKRPPSFYNALVENVCIGHTQVLNAEAAKLADELYSPDMVIMDYWIYLLVSAFGEITFDPTPTTLYRQHGQNSIGYETGFFKRLFKRLKRALTTSRAKGNTRQLAAFLDLTRDRLPEEYLLEARRFLEKQRKFFTRLSYIFTAKAYRHSAAEGFVFRIMYLFGKYKIKKQKSDKGATK